MGLVLSSSANGKVVCVMLWWIFLFCFVSFQGMCHNMFVLQKASGLKGRVIFGDPLGTRRLIVQIGSARVITNMSSLSQWSWGK